MSDELPGGGQVIRGLQELNRAVFIGTDLPDPGQDRYQLWTGTGDPTVPEQITGLTRDNQIAEDGSGRQGVLQRQRCRL